MSTVIALIEKKQEARVSSLVLAESLDIQHKNVLALIKENIAAFKEIDRLTFETRKGEPLPQGGFAKSTRYASLTEDQSYFLLTLTRNTERTKRLKLDLVKSFGRFRRDQQTAVDYLPFYHDLHDAIKTLASYAQANGSTTEARIYHLNYNKLINKACGIDGSQRQHLAVNTRVNITNATAAVITAIKHGINAAVDCSEIYQRAKGAVNAAVYIGNDNAITHIDFKAGRPL